MRLRAFAKINYSLAVRGFRDDGYHEVATVMQSISLADEIEIEQTGSGFELHVDPERTEVGPLDENTMYKAWSRLGNAVGEELPVTVRLLKNIPSGAGLGGASADAAAMLIGTNELFGLGLPMEKLQGIGARVGADVPFCISGGTALGEGVGEVLTPLPAPPVHKLLVVKPVSSAETAKIYCSYDENPTQSAAVELVVGALRARDLNALAESLGNDLTPTTRGIVPEVAEYEKGLLETGALGACMSGTGTAVYGMFFGEREARAAAELLEAPFCSICSPVAQSTEML